MGNSEVGWAATLPLRLLYCCTSARCFQGARLSSSQRLIDAQVGHNALGAGQIIDQGARLVDKAVQVHSAFQISGLLLIKSQAPLDVPFDLCLTLTCSQLNVYPSARR